MSSTNQSNTLPRIQAKLIFAKCRSFGSIAHGSGLDLHMIGVPGFFSIGSSCKKFRSILRSKHHNWTIPIQSFRPVWNLGILGKSTSHPSWRASRWPQTAALAWPSQALLLFSIPLYKPTKAAKAHKSALDFPLSFMETSKVGRSLLLGKFGLVKTEK